MSVEYVIIGAMQDAPTAASVRARRVFINRR